MSMSSPWPQLIASYAEWLRKRITFVELEHACEITTPFLDRHNDYLQLYARLESDGFLLTDDGATIRDLDLSGCEIRSGRRRILLDTLLRGYGVQLTDDELQVHANVETFPQRKHSLVQAILAVNDMFLTARGHVASLFLEDVEQYLSSHEVRFVRNAQFTGKSGFTHAFDFVIPRSQRGPERILRAINNPDRNSATNFLFAWNDTRDARPAGSKGFAILNDQERAPSSDVLSALRQYGSTPMLWSRREEFVEELAA